MAKAFRLPSLDEATVAALQQQYDTTSDADRRLRPQMVLLAHQGRSVSDIAPITLRSVACRPSPVAKLLAPPRPFLPRGKPRCFASSSSTPYAWRALGQLDDLAPGRVSGARHRHDGLGGDGAPPALCQRLRLHATDLDAQTQGRSPSGRRGKRLRGEVLLAGAGR
ncbi:MAG: hypothetical protein MI924_20895, partial [Chloroflexales bacterium]|nr:hypothetical protein [Chloroflexales bacterium]